MSHLADIDTGLRGAVLGLLFLLGCHLAWQAPRARITQACVALAAALAGYVIVSAGPCVPPDCAPGAVHRAGAPLAMIAPAMLWWAGLELFELARPLRRLVAPAALALLVLGFAAGIWPLAGSLRGVLIAGLYAHLLIAAWQSAPGDLVEARRSFRRWLASAAAVLGLVITAVELAVPDSAIGLPLRTFQAAMLLLLVLGFALWLMRVRDAFWPAATRAPAATAPPTAGAADRAVIERLEAAMTAGIWRREGLTIGALAAEIGTPEHRLRQIINRVLGQRNFARFINERRIEAAKQALADPAQAGTPVLTIAYECGFASLGPFNRAFRDITGQSPTAYRAAQIADS